MPRTGRSENSPYTRRVFNTFVQLRNANPQAEVHHLLHEMGITRGEFVQKLATEFIVATGDLAALLVGERISLSRGHPELNRRIGPLINLLNYAPPRDYSLDRDVLHLILDEFDHETFMHSDRVRDYCMKMARRMGMSPAQENPLALAARLHDIGKVAVPTGILGKPERLDPEERHVMDLHQIIGYLLLRGVHALREVADIMAYTHVEQGYPEEFVGKEVSPQSHILIVADTFDACLSYREYRQGQRMPMRAVFEEVVLKHQKPRHPLPIAIAAALAYEIDRADAKRVLSSVFTEPDELRFIESTFD